MTSRGLLTRFQTVACAVLLAYPLTARAQAPWAIEVSPTDPKIGLHGSQQFSAFGGPIDMVVGGYHACALIADGTAVCWGDDSWGEVGDAAVGVNLLNSLGTIIRFTPQQVQILTDVTAISAGGQHTCAIDHGAVHCWGLGPDGQLGLGTSPIMATVPIPVGLSGATAISAGFNHTCALTSGGIYCWGENLNGQLGDGTTTTQYTPVPAATSLSNPTQITLGAAHTCALLPDGTVWCWGAGLMLGNGTGADSHNPVQVSSLSGVKKIAAGTFHTCALDSGGTVQCWGDNDGGQLGDGTTANRLTSVPVTLSGPATDIVAGPQDTCALVHDPTLQDSTIECWGLNANFGSSPTPVQVTYQSGDPFVGAIALATGGYSPEDNVTCALFTEGQVVCWGNNQYGQVGNPNAQWGTGTSLDSRWPIWMSDPLWVPLTGAQWSSSGGAASINSTGPATALSSGATTITATAPLTGASASTVLTVNTPPTTQNATATTNEDTDLIISVLSDYADADGDPLTTLTVSTPTQHGTITPDLYGTFKYSPALNFNGTDSFTYTAGDGYDASGEVTVTITVNPANDPPVASNDGVYEIDENATLTVPASSGVLNNDIDVDGDPLTASVAQDPLHGTLDLHADGSFTYSPQADFHGPDSFAYTASDTQAQSAAATVTLSVKQVAKLAQTITFSALTDKTYGDVPFTVSATASSGLPVTFGAGGTWWSRTSLPASHGRPARPASQRSPPRGASPRQSIRVPA